MQFNRQPQSLCSIKNSLDLCWGERKVLTECVNGIRQFFSGDNGQQGIANKVDIVLRPVFVLGRQGMGGKTGGLNIDRQQSG
ncbi:N-formimino-L-glutamate deiminase [Klebsiella quasivariicola]|nr:N-formimino-L-glutamate deiminase [Klebsiella quasivariicola]